MNANSEALRTNPKLEKWWKRIKTFYVGLTVAAVIGPLNIIYLAIFGGNMPVSPVIFLFPILGLAWAVTVYIGVSQIKRWALWLMIIEMAATILFGLYYAGKWSGEIFLYTSLAPGYLIFLVIKIVLLVQYSKILKQVAVQRNATESIVR